MKHGHRLLHVVGIRSEGLPGDHRRLDMNHGPVRRRVNRERFRAMNPTESKHIQSQEWGPKTPHSQGSAAAGVAYCEGTTKVEALFLVKASNESPPVPGR
jgi:hypothetical protein